MIASFFKTDLLTEKEQKFHDADSVKEVAFGV
jgi:hypothetical protein